MEPANKIEHEASATVQEVLAFIDACEAAKITHEAKPTRPRSQIGHEMKRLRREARYLEMRLRQLTTGSNSGSATLKTEVGRAKWVEAILQEYQRYQQSKRMNQMLKTRLAKQQETIVALNVQIAMAAQNCAMEDLQVMASLADRLGKLELDLDNILVHTGLAQADSLTARTLRTVDVDQTLVSEKAFCWPVRCSFVQTDQYMVSRFGQRLAAIKAAREASKLTKVVYFEHEKQPHELRAKTIMHRIVQADRVVYLESSLLSLVSERLTFVEDCIYIVRRPALSSASVSLPPASGSLLLGWHCIRAVQHNSSSESEFQSLKEMVVARASDRVVGKLQKARSRIQGAQYTRKAKDEQASGLVCRHAYVAAYCLAHSAMSFLLATDEGATLEAALAFIDAFEPKDNVLKKRSTADKRSRRLPVKEELQQLRRLVPELETALARVIESRGWHLPAQRSVWMQNAAHEYRRRRQTETTNRQLKRMLAKLLGSIQASRDAVLQPMAKEDLTLLYEPQLTRALHQRAIEESLVVALLAHRLQTLRLDMDSMMQRAGLVDANDWFSRKLRRVDSKLGALVESSCCLPMGGSMELTAELFWRNFYHRLTADNEHSMQVSELNGHGKTHVHTFGQTSYELDVKMSVRKHVDEDRVVIMWSSVAPMTAKGVRFILDNMVVIKRVQSPSEVPSLKPGSLLQGWFRAYAERFGSPESNSSDVAGFESLSDHVMDAMSNHLANYLTAFKSVYPDSA